jgi:hypothetical protein
MEDEERGCSGWSVPSWAGVGPGVRPGPADLPDPVLGGFLALFRGFSQIFLAFTVRHAGHEAATALGDTSPA